MRTILIAAMILAASAAGAQDFGVNFETAHEKITKVIRPGIQFQGCKGKDCHYFDKAADLDLFVGLEDSGAVSSFSVFFLAHSWAVAAHTAARIQSEVYVPASEIVGLERSAQRATEGHEDIVFSAYVHCVTQVKDKDLSIHCRRK